MSGDGMYSSTRTRRSTAKPASLEKEPQRTQAASRSRSRSDLAV